MEFCAFGQTHTKYISNQQIDEAEERLHDLVETAYVVSIEPTTVDLEVYELDNLDSINEWVESIKALENEPV